MAKKTTKPVKSKAKEPDEMGEYFLTDMYGNPIYSLGGWFKENLGNVLKTAGGIGAMFIPGMQAVGAGLIGSGVGSMIGGIGQDEEENVNYINETEAPRVVGSKYLTPNVMSFADGGKKDPEDLPYEQQPFFLAKQLISHFKKHPEKFEMSNKSYKMDEKVFEKYPEFEYIKDWAVQPSHYTVIKDLEQDIEFPYPAYNYDQVVESMNTDKYKSGGIHIKPSKRGSFTAWCKSHGYGGVTEECIRKGKASSSTAIRKKATFAKNARGWNKADGGPMNDEDKSNLMPLPLGYYLAKIADNYTWDEESPIPEEQEGKFFRPLRLVVKKKDEDLYLRRKKKVDDEEELPEESFMDYEYGSGGLRDLTPDKAREMLKNPPHGKPLSEKQRKTFLAISHGWKPKRADGGMKTPLVEFVGPKHEQGGIQLGDAEVEGGETMFNNVINSDRDYMKITKEIAKEYGLDSKAVGKTPGQYSSMIEDQFEGQDNDPFAMKDRERILDRLSKLSIDLSEGAKKKIYQGGGVLEKNDRIDFGSLAYRRLGAVPQRDLRTERERLMSEYYGQGFSEDFDENKRIFMETYFPGISEGTIDYAQYDGMTPTDKYFDQLYDIHGYQPIKSASNQPPYPAATPTGQPIVVNKNAPPVKNAPITTPREDVVIPRAPMLDNASQVIRGERNNVTPIAPRIDVFDPSSIGLRGIDDIKEPGYGITDSGSNEFDLSGSEGLTDIMGLAPIAISAFQAARAGKRKPAEVRAEKIRPQEVTPDLVDPTFTLQEISDTYAGGLEGIKDVSKKDYMRRAIQAKTEEAKTKSQALGQIINYNTQLKNRAEELNTSNQLRADSINAELGLRVEDINAANEAAVESTRDMYINNLATMIGQYAKDLKLDASSERYNERVFEIMENMYPGLNFDRSQGYSAGSMELPADPSSVWGDTGMRYKTPEYPAGSSIYGGASNLERNFAPRSSNYGLPFGRAPYLYDPNFSSRLSINPYNR